MRATVSWVWFLCVLLLAGSVHADPVHQRLPFTVTTNLTSGALYSFRFSLFDTGALNTGTEVWREVRNYRVPATKVITHQLGSIVPFSEGMHGTDPAVDAVPVDFTRQLWVEVAAGTFRRRVKLTVVPFALATVGLRVVPDATSPNIIAGFAENDVAPGVHGATVAGGGALDPYDPADTHANEVTGNFGTVGGGQDNQAAQHGVVAGGSGNVASGDTASVLGGTDNQATGAEATALGGSGNRAGGDGSTVAGGCSNASGGYRAFAGGEQANASRRGMFVWSATDDQDPDGGSDARYSHVFEYDGFPQSTLGAGPNTLLKDMQFWVKSPGGVFFVTGRDDTGLPLGVMLPQGAQVWEPITPALPSDAGLKRDFAGVDAAAVLERVASLPVATWSYAREQGRARHIGPMAQDFFAAFGVGEDDRHINPLDGAGVSLAAIQGLYAVVRDLRRQMADQEDALRAEIAALRARLSELALGPGAPRVVVAGAADLRAGGPDEPGRAVTTP